MVYPENFRVQGAKRIMSFRAAQGGKKLDRVFNPAAPDNMWGKL